MTVERPQVVGSVIAAYLVEIDARGLREAVRAKATPAVRALLDSPPIPTAWIDTAPMAEFTQAVVAAAGEKVLAEMSWDAQRHSLGRIYGKLAEAVIAMKGPNPHYLLRGYGKGAVLTARGLNFEYEQESPTVARMRISSTEPLPPEYWITWEGPFGYTAEQCGLVARVERTPNPGPAKSSRYRVDWT